MGIVVRDWSMCPGKGAPRVGGGWGVNNLGYLPSPNYCTRASLTSQLSAVIPGLSQEGFKKDFNWNFSEDLAIELTYGCTYFSQPPILGSLRLFGDRCQRLEAAAVTGWIHRSETRTL